MTRFLTSILSDSKPNSIVLSTAFTGVRYHPDKLMNRGGVREEVPVGHFAENMPITPEEMARDAKACFDAGSRYFHIHARNPKTGRQSGEGYDYHRTFQAVRKVVPGILLGGPTSRKEEVGDVLTRATERYEKSGEPLTPEGYATVELNRAWPAVNGGTDFLTLFTEPDILSPPEIAKFDANERAASQPRRWPETIRHYFSQLADVTKVAGIYHEVEITHLQTLATLEKLTDDPKFKLGSTGNKVHAVVLLGFSEGLPINEETFLEAMKRLTALQKKTGLDFTISVGAVIMPKNMAPHERHYGETLPPGKHDYREVIEWVIDYNRKAKKSGVLPVSIFRTGLEDTPVLYGKQQTNASLTRHATDIFREHDIKIETNQQKVNDTLTQAKKKKSFCAMG
jgi:hypothetical protein